MAPESLLAVLRDEAITLVESELPTTEELRSVVGALVKALERLSDDVDRFRAPEQPVSTATSGVPVTGAAPVPSVAAQPADATVPAGSISADPIATGPQTDAGTTGQDPVAAANSAVEAEPADEPLSVEEQELLAALQARASAAPATDTSGQASEPATDPATGAQA